MESLLVEDDVISRQTGIKAEKGHKFWSDRWIAVQVLQQFPEAVFLVLLMESLLIEEEALWSQTGMTGEKGHNFWFYRWIALKVLQ
jgi:hypothetical protein